MVVDMWNVHWCHTATTRVGEIAIPMNQTLSAARNAGVHIVYAPSDVTSFYDGTEARKRTLALRNVSLPTSNAHSAPPFPLDTSTNGGCDAAAKQGSPWTRQIASIAIDEAVDYLVAGDDIDRHRHPSTFSAHARLHTPCQ